MKSLFQLTATLFVAITMLSRPVAAGELSASPQTMRVYFIGNSVTDTVKYDAFAEAVQGMDCKLKWGRQMIPGSPLFWLWRAAEGKPEDCGFTKNPYGGSIQALRDFEWDAVTLQPFDRLLANADPKEADEQGDILYAQKYLDLTLQRSPNAQVYIYARWPRMLVKGKGIDFDKDAYDKPTSGKTADWSQVDAFGQRWQTRYTGGWDTSNETADYFETLTRILRKVNPTVHKPVLMIPVGHVMFELDKMMQSGELPGYKGIYDVYKDAIHLTDAGSYIVGCTFYATVFKKDPKGFPGEPYKVSDSKLMAVVQKVVWQVVKNHPLAGVAPQESIKQGN